MISSIRGDVLEVGLGHAVIDVSGFGLHVIATPQTLGGLHAGASTRLSTSYVPRQDEAPLLFGFADAAEREIFTTLLSISGVGPRLALAVLSVHSPDEVKIAISESDTAALTRVPGIGKKTAQRILLELAGKLVLDEPEQPQTGRPAEHPVQEQVQQALGSLGWSEKDARAAVEKSMAQEPELAEAEVSVVLRHTLRMLGGTRS